MAEAVPRCREARGVALALAAGLWPRGDVVGLELNCHLSTQFSPAGLTVQRCYVLKGAYWSPEWCCGGSVSLDSESFFPLNSFFSMRNSPGNSQWVRGRFGLHVATI